jgi:hypothetical protein
MRRRRARTVGIMASVALAAVAIGIFSPASRLRAQNPGGSQPPVAEKIGDASPTLPDPSPPTAEKPAEAATLPPASAPAAAADPEAAAVAFVERSQKEADEAVRALSKEAETLRARLQKVEAGLARWESVKEALADHGNQVEANAGRPAWRSRGSTRPGVVERAGPADSDKASSVLPPAREPSRSRIEPPPRESNVKPDSSPTKGLPDPPPIEKGREPEGLSTASETTSPPIPPALPDFKPAPPSLPLTNVPK